MRRLPLCAALVLGLVLSACSDSPCQELGERICACQPGGLSADTCTAQVEKQLENLDPGDAQCEAWLGSCQAPAGKELCEWMLTADGKRKCGLAPPASAP